MPTNYATYLSDFKFACLLYIRIGTEGRSEQIGQRLEIHNALMNAIRRILQSMIAFLKQNTHLTIY